MLGIFARSPERRPEGVDEFAGAFGATPLRIGDVLLNGFEVAGCPRTDDEAAHLRFFIRAAFFFLSLSITSSPSSGSPLASESRKIPVDLLPHLPLLLSADQSTHVFAGRAVHAPFHLGLNELLRRTGREMLRLVPGLSSMPS